MTNKSAHVVYNSHDDNDRKENNDSGLLLYDNNPIQPMLLVPKRIPLIIHLPCTCFQNSKNRHHGSCYLRQAVII